MSADKFADLLLIGALGTSALGAIYAAWCEWTSR
jgi:hypothetical protein